MKRLFDFLTGPLSLKGGYAEVLFVNISWKNPRNFVVTVPEEIAGFFQLGALKFDGGVLTLEVSAAPTDATVRFAALVSCDTDEIGDQKKTAVDISKTWPSLKEG